MWRASGSLRREAVEEMQRMEENGGEERASEGTGERRNEGTLGRNRGRVKGMDGGDRTTRRRLGSVTTSWARGLKGPGRAGSEGERIRSSKHGGLAHWLRTSWTLRVAPPTSELYVVKISIICASQGYRKHK